MPWASPRGCVNDSRVPYAEAAAAGRYVLERANALSGPDALTTRDRKVLDAVVTFTALWSKTEDRVYLAQLAAFSFGADQVSPWMIKRTRESLQRLSARGLVECSAPRGRPPAGAGPAYRIALPVPPETTLDPGVTYDPGKHPEVEVTNRPESDLDPEVTSSEKRTSVLDRKGPRSWTEKDLAPGDPTEKCPEKTPEPLAADEVQVEARRRLEAKKRNGESIQNEKGLLAYLEVEVERERQQRREGVLAGADSVGRSRIGNSNESELLEELHARYGDDVEARDRALSAWRAGEGRAAS